MNSPRNLIFLDISCGPAPCERQNAISPASDASVSRDRHSDFQANPYVKGFQANIMNGNGSRQYHIERDQ